MITAVDTNIILDLVLPDPRYVDQSLEALLLAAQSGGVIISEPVYAEIAGRFEDQGSFDEFIREIGLELQSSGRDVLHTAGSAWQQYARRRTNRLNCPACGATRDIHCEQCGEPMRGRQHLLADFLIGAHARVYADRLLTRDRGYYATYFPELALI